MRKPTPAIEWIVTENDAEWERLQRPPLSQKLPTVGNQRYHGHILWNAIVLILILTGIDYWVSHTDQPAQLQAPMTPEVKGESEVGADEQVPAGLITSRIDEQTAPEWQRQFALDADSLRSTLLTHAPGDQITTNYHLIAQQADQVVLNVIMTAKYQTQALRQTRFYRRTSGAWLRMTPAVALWGAKQTLETPSFVFSFRAQDAQAVAVAAPQIEALYTTMRQTFGLSMTKKLVITISVTQRPGITPTQMHPVSAFSVPSPALYLAPIELTDGQILSQSIVLQLLDHLLAQATVASPFNPAWRPMRDGLYLWQLWDLELPLSAWREDVVKWIYHDLPATSSVEIVHLPDRYTAFCTAHNLRLSYPVQIGIPLWCHGLDQKKTISHWWRQFVPPTHLAQLGAPVLPTAHPALEAVTEPVTYPGQTVALATLIEYTVATYGRERLPILVTGLGHYNRWETLIPAVYGVSPAAFEAGWQSYLAAHYGISLASAKS